MEFDLAVDRIAAGGDGIGQAPDGRVVFVRGGLPGDRLSVRVVQEKKQFLRAEIVQVNRGASGRVDPPCIHARDGCGGCDWQHAGAQLQTQLRVAVVSDSLRRLAKLDGADVRPGPQLPVDGYRTTVRCIVSNGKAGFRRQRSHKALIPDQCLVAHPLVQEIMSSGNFGEANEVTIRVGARTGERLVQLDERAEIAVPADVLVGWPDRVEAVHEEVAGHRFRISGRSFFQCRPDGAEALVQLVAEAIDGSDGPLVDAYAGVGLFGTVYGQERAVTAIERSSSSAADAVANLAAHAKVETVAVEDWLPTPAAVVIADPSRRGLGPAGVRPLVATKAQVIALVSCDPASLGRDAGLLTAAGYQLDWVRTLDIFGHTSHVETVSRFSRS